MQLLDVLLPRRCGVCGRVGESVCATCLARFVRCAPPWCERCGAPGPWPVRRCAECSGRRLAFARARAAVVYDGEREGIRRRSWKERGRRDLTTVAAELVVDDAAATGGRGGRIRSRRPRSGPCPRPCPGCRARVGALRRLVDPARRASAPPVRGSLANATCPAPSAAGTWPGPSPPRGRPRAAVCLVDDVYTTGSTATACATALRRAGARHVEVVCLAQGSAVVG